MQGCLGKYVHFHVIFCVFYCMNIIILGEYETNTLRGNIRVKK